MSGQAEMAERLLRYCMPNTKATLAEIIIINSYNNACFENAHRTNLFKNDNVSYFLLLEIIAWLAKRGKQND